MHDKKMLTDEEFKVLTKFLDGSFTAINIMSAKTKIEKLFTAAASFASIATENETGKMLIEQEGQLFNETKVLLELSKKIK